MRERSKECRRYLRQTIAAPTPTAFRSIYGDDVMLAATFAYDGTDLVRTPLVGTIDPETAQRIKSRAAGRTLTAVLA